jgi:hypothetical protein
MRWIIFLLVVILLMPFAAAQDVKVSTYVLNLGKFDVATGSFTADFYLWFVCEENCTPQFEFMNGRATSVDTIVDEPKEKFYRIQANLNSPVDLRQFPFDKQVMQIIIEDKESQVDEITFVPVRQSGIDDSNRFVGWQFDGWSTNVTEHNYDIYNETYSQYTFNAHISRIPQNSFLKTFLPVIFIMLVVLFSFILDPDKLGTRLAMAGSSLVATVMFHISISNQIPPVGYLTFADKFMVLTYFILLATFIINMFMMEMLERKKDKLVEGFHRRIEFLPFFVVPLLYILLFVLFL